MNLLRVFRHKRIKIPIRRILILICTFIMSTFAWFVYTKTAQTGIELHINTWNIEFYDSNGENISNNIEIQFDNLYPTMLDQTKTFIIKNNGEVNANVSFTINTITMLGQNYNVVQSSSEATQDGLYVIKGAEITKADDTSKKEIYYINEPERFPFKLKLESDKSVVANGGTGTISATFSWSGLDESKYNLDTTWGYNMAIYKSEHSEDAGIGFELKINIHQEQEENT